MGEEQVQRFTVQSTRILGVIGLVIVAVFVLVGATGIDDSYEAPAYIVCGIVAMLLWVAVLRPSVAVEGDRLVLRNPLNTVRIPLAAIEQLVIRQWLVVSVGGRRYTNAGISRSRRQGMRDDRHTGDTGEELGALSYGGFAERRIQKLAEDARERLGVKPYSDEQEARAADVQRDWAWPEIAALCLLAVALVVTLLV
ncbi:Asp23/Gls24 family envelope stress response protein [Nocardioides bizhenqiangii]|uniref:PH domain-containing protein n=1 Tax=Nocardioides bizhenqiangii TaxID=3095076 RepID=A0ABZ0ZMQ0_9ACTN|nr:MULTISPECIES: hypothetical protein [unclassified Nocardioides]MDZ5621579.1 hypothetical protein [Nocardioides sp. HM23]WQQ25584.1 hypothetical protein SHK19_16655 [Nocardioides sp. HM61]